MALQKAFEKQQSQFLIAFFQKVNGSEVLYQNVLKLCAEFSQVQVGEIIIKRMTERMHYFNLFSVVHDYPHPILLHLLLEHKLVTLPLLVGFQCFTSERNDFRIAFEAGIDIDALYYDSTFEKNICRTIYRQWYYETLFSFFQFLFPSTLIDEITEYFVLSENCM